MKASSIPHTGEFLRQSTHQGWRGDSLWARGLTWALYGFGTAYRFSGDARFLQTAEACAACYLEHTPAHGVPPNDWLEPDAAAPLRKLRRRHRGQRLPATGNADRRPPARPPLPR